MEENGDLREDRRKGRRKVRAFWKRRKVWITLLAVVVATLLAMTIIRQMDIALRNAEIQGR